MNRLLSLAVPAVLLINYVSATEPKVDLPNASLQYWLAFSLLSDMPKEDREQIIGIPRNPALGQRRTDLVQKMDWIIRYLHHGAAMPRADWGIVFDVDGPCAPKPYLSKCRPLAKAGLFVAQEHFDKGRHIQGIDVIFMVLALGRHISDENTIVGKIVEMGISRMALEMLAQQLPKLPREELAKIDARFAALPRGKLFADVLKVEREIGKWMFEQSFEQSVDRVMAIAALSGHDERLLNSLRKLLTPELMKVEKERLKAVYDALDTLASVPYAESGPALDLAIERTRKSELAKSLCFSPNRLFEIIEEMKADIAMTKAAAQLLLNGRTTFEKIQDPYGDSAFGYNKFTNGFELSTKLRCDGRPIKRVFGERAPAQNANTSVDSVKPPRPPWDENGEF